MSGSASSVVQVTPRMAAIALLARREAELRGHAATNWDHLWWALLWEGDGAAVQVLLDLGMAHALGDLVQWHLSEGSSPPTMDGILLRAADDARQCGHSYLGTEHVLIATLTLDGPARRFFDASGRLDEVRSNVERVFPRD